MTIAEIASRYSAPAVLGSASAVAIGFAMTFLAIGKPGWWWIVLAVAGLVAAGSAVWVYVLQHSDALDHRPEQRDPDTPHQSATGDGQNISIRADNGSVAAWEIGTVNMDQPAKPET